MDVKSIDKKKKIGDYYTVSLMLGITTEAARQSWYRKEGNTFLKVKIALEKVIKIRESLVNQK